MSNLPAASIGATAVSDGYIYRCTSNTSWDIVHDVAPIHHWTLSDYSGTNVANDRGTNPMVGSITSCVLSQTGIISRCMQFTGTASYVNCGVLTDIGSNNYSMFAWVNSAASQTAAAGIISHGLNLAGQFRTMAINPNGTWRLWGNTDNLTATTVLANATWYHLGITINSLNSVTLYTNGITDATPTALSLVVFAGNTITVIGCTNSLTAGTTFNGYIEDVRIYDRVLTEQEISAIYNEGKGTYEHSYKSGFPTVKEPIAHYKLQELTFGAVSLVNNSGSDISVGFPTSVVQGAATTIKNVPYSYQFTGTASYIVVGTQTVYGAVDYTLAVWQKTSVTGTAQYYFAQNVDGNHELRFFVNTDNTPGLWTYEGGYAFVTTSVVVTDGKWHHVCVSKRDTTGILYVDGANPSTGTVVNISGTASYMQIGAYNPVGSPAALFNGYLSDFRIYDYALSAQEVKNLYNRGMGTLL